MGTPMPTSCHGGKYRCKQKVAGTHRETRCEWDMFGHHLSGQCGWGGWRIKRHDDIARVLMQYMRAAGMRATDKCLQVFPACPSAVEGETARGLRTTRIIPDIISTDHYGATTIYDVMVTSVTGQTDAATKPLWAAKRGEHTKERKYDAFRTKCREAGLVDTSLSIPMIPLVFENFGAAGPQTLEFVRGVRRHYSTQVLDLEDLSAESYFHSFWAHNISVALMRGTAEIIYNVPRGEAVPARYRRPTKEAQHKMSSTRSTGARRPRRGRPRRARSPSPQNSQSLSAPDDDASDADGYASSTTSTVATTGGSPHHT